MIEGKVEGEKGKCRQRLQYTDKNILDVGCSKYVGIKRNIGEIGGVRCP